VNKLFYFIFANITDRRWTVNTKQTRNRNDKNEIKIPNYM